MLSIALRGSCVAMFGTALLASASAHAQPRGESQFGMGPPVTPVTALPPR
jgi:hypothetical protein